MRGYNKNGKLTRAIVNRPWLPRIGATKGRVIG